MALLGLVRRGALLQARVKLGRAITRAKKRNAEVIYISVTDAEVMRDLLSAAIIGLENEVERL